MTKHRTEPKVGDLVLFYNAVIPTQEERGDIPFVASIWGVIRDYKTNNYGAGHTPEPKTLALITRRTEDILEVVNCYGTVYRINQNYLDTTT